MYRNHYTSSSSGAPPSQYGYDRYEASSYSSYPPPPPAGPPPPPPSTRWDDQQASGTRDNYYPQERERRSGRASRGPHSDLRRPNSNDGPRDYRDNAHPPQGDFSFRVERPAGIDSYRPSTQDERGQAQYSRRDDPKRPHRRDDARPGGRDRYHPRNNGRGGQQYRSGPHKPYTRAKPHERLLLVKQHDNQAQLMLGDTTGRASYKDVDAMSDSDETAMDISDNSDSGAAEPASKRARTSAPTAQAGQDLPKWSNPDPYTALPPPDESARKKKDMVQLIRKARVEAEAKKPSESTEAADFISFDFSEDEGDNKNDKGVDGRSKKRLGSTGEGMPDAPKGPRVTSSSSSTLPKYSTSAVDAAPRAPRVDQSAPHTSRTTRGSKQEPVDLSPSTSLGNRKRTFDDQIKLPHASLKKVSRMAAGGDVVPVWRPEKGEDPCPWATTDHSATACMGTRLHKEIMDFYEYVRPRDFEERIRHEMLSRLSALVKRKWRDAEVYAFGSFMSGLYLPTADMDVAICSESFVNRGIPKYHTKSSLYALRTFFHYHKIAFKDDIDLITKAKVPLVKYTDQVTALKVDISLEKMDGHRAVQTFLDWKKRYPAMPILVAIIKHFLLMRGLNEPVNGGIGGFSVICMVVNLLNQMPQVQSGSMKPEHHLNEILMEFFDYYGNHFQYKTVAIRMNPPGLVNKSEVSTLSYRNMDRLSIIDPNNPDNDIAGGSSNTETIFSHFSKAYSTLRNRMAKLAKEGTPINSNSSDRTILGPLFAGKYSNFQVQRDYLKRLSATELPEYGVKGTSFRQSIY
ncbi:hypothetical protein F5X99DRAFT_375287 [Biscogniauxia marginata]|nr:hypothetical protein F5X99DRAFT_375287 [Biscogniauxia marginata]